MLAPKMLKVFFVFSHILVTLTAILLLFVGFFYFTDIYIKIILCILYLFLFIFFYTQLYLIYRKSSYLNPSLLIESLNKSSEHILITDSKGLIIFANNGVEKSYWLQGF